MNPGKLKLGLLLDSFDMPAWIYHSIKQIVNSDCGEFSLIILNESANIQNRNNKAWKNKRTFVYEMFNAIDERIFIRGARATEIKNGRDLLGSATIIKVKPAKKGNANYFEPSDIDNVCEFGLDILVKIGFEDLRGGILSAAKFGVWEYSLGNPHGFWEVMGGQSETRVALHILDDETNTGKTIFSSSASTYPFSPARNKNRSLWKSSSFLPRQIALLYWLGERNYFEEAQKYDHDKGPHIQKGHEIPPSNLLSLRLIAKFLTILVREILSRIFTREVWFLMFDLDSNSSVPLENYKRIMPPKGRFWADPHIIQKDDRHFIFIEEYAFEMKKGYLSVLEIDQSGKHTMPVRILEKEYHLSYPHVFKWNDRYYMVPESAANRTIDLYESIDFPYKWEFKMTLMENIEAVDTTLLFYQEKWWLFTGISENEGSFPEVELFLFSADDLFTRDWKPHLLNPIKSDVKNSRPAGRIFSRDGKLFRPSQDCSKTYGYGFDLNEILVLSDTEYIEERIVAVRPDWDKKIFATHTYGVEGKLKIMDACTTRRRFL